MMGKVILGWRGSFHRYTKSVFLLARPGKNPMSASSDLPPTFDQVTHHESGWEAVRCSSLDSMRTQNVLFWQRQGGAAIRQAAWELVLDVWKAQKRDPDELRFQRIAPNLR